MGCTQSKIDGEEPVTRCRDRKHLMKDAVSSRNAFAAAHSGYTVSLRNTGAAFSDFAQGQVILSIANPIIGTPTDPSPLPPPSNQPSSSSSAAAAAATVVPPSDAALPPPPPPLPNFAPPLQRAASMPEISLPKKQKQPAAIPASVEEGDADDEKDDDAEPPPVKRTSAYAPSPSSASGSSGWLGVGEYIFDTNSVPGPSLDHPEEDPPLQPPPRPVTPEIVEKVVDEPPPPPPPLTTRPKEKPAVVKKQKAAGAAAGEGKKGRMASAAGGPKVNLLQVLNKVDDHFLQASESAQDVSKMLEATRMHYHSNFADNRGHIDHSAKLLRVITWNRSLKGLPKEDEEKDDVDSDELETHATILDKMLAWEKKLYDEVKADDVKMRQFIWYSISISCTVAPEQPK